MRTEEEVRKELKRVIEELERLKTYGDLSMAWPYKITIAQLKWVLGED